MGLVMVHTHMGFAYTHAEFKNQKWFLLLKILVTFSLEAIG